LPFSSFSMTASFLNKFRLTFPLKVPPLNLIKLELA
jgi:hypothetical protein